MNRQGVEEDGGGVTGDFMDKNLSIGQTVYLEELIKLGFKMITGGMVPDTEDKKYIFNADKGGFIVEKDHTIHKFKVTGRFC